MMDDNGYVALSEKVTATFYDDKHEEWTQKTMTIADILDSVCDDYTMIPSAQPETYKEKLKEIADALSEKFAYMNTCLNERDIILGYLGVKRPSKTHCNTDCTNIKCESYRYNKRLPSVQPKIKTDGDTISRQAAIDALYKMLHDCFWADDEELDAVITTLNDLPSAQPEFAKDKNVPSNDCVSRQAAIDAVEESRRFNHHEDSKLALNHEYEHRHFLKILHELPPAQPKTGWWIDDHCSECGQYVFHEDVRNFCPSCGAKMLKEGEE